MAAYSRMDSAVATTRVVARRSIRPGLALERPGVRHIAFYLAAYPVVAQLGRRFAAGEVSEPAPRWPVDAPSPSDVELIRQLVELLGGQTARHLGQRLLVLNVVVLLEDQLLRVSGRNIKGE